MTPEETENEVSVQVKQINKTLRMHIVANLLYKRVSRLYTKLSLARPKPPECVMNALYEKCVALQRMLWDELEYDTAKVVYDEMQRAVNNFEQLVATTKINYITEV